MPNHDQLTPLVGIWWDNGRTLVALAHDLTENSSGTYLIDSSLRHREQWPQVATILGFPPNSPYLSVPYGRILVHRETRTGLIYHGPATPPERLVKIAARFHLGTWKSQLEEHSEQAYLFPEDSECADSYARSHFLDTCSLLQDPETKALYRFIQASKRHEP